MYFKTYYYNINFNKRKIIFYLLRLKITFFTFNTYHFVLQYMYTFPSLLIYNNFDQYLLYFEFLHFIIRKSRNIYFLIPLHNLSVF